MSVLIKSDRDKKWSNLDLNPPNRSSHSAMGRHSLFSHTCTCLSFSAQFRARPCTVCLGDTEVDKTVSLPPRSSKSSPPPPSLPCFFPSGSCLGRGYLPIHAFLQNWNLLPSFSLLSPSPSGSKCPVEHNISKPLPSHL